MSFKWRQDSFQPGAGGERKQVSLYYNGVWDQTRKKQMQIDWSWNLEDVLSSASNRMPELNGGKATRLFNTDGAEIDDAMMIGNDDILFVSEGEDFIVPVNNNTSGSSRSRKRGDSSVSPLGTEEDRNTTNGNSSNSSSNSGNLNESMEGGIYDEYAEKGDNLPPIIGNYHVSSFLGRGGFGVVRVGRHQLTDEKVALKFVSKKEILTIHAAERTMTEIQCLTTLKHSNIITLQEYIETNNHVVLMFEIMAGGDLLSYLKQEYASWERLGGNLGDSEDPNRLLDRQNCSSSGHDHMAILDEYTAKMVFSQVVGAVSFAHNHHICHRDLKLENILLKNKGDICVVKVADFGLSEFYRPGEARKNNSGTLCFLAPEAFRDSSSTGPPLDVWALGVILFTMLSGRLPFDAPATRPKDPIVRDREDTTEAKEGTGGAASAFGGTFNTGTGAGGNVGNNNGRDLFGGVRGDKDDRDRDRDRDDNTGISPPVKAIPRQREYRPDVIIKNKISKGVYSFDNALGQYNIQGGGSSVAVTAGGNTNSTASVKKDVSLSLEAQDIIRRMLVLNPEARATVPDVYNHIWNSGLSKRNGGFSTGLVGSASRGINTNSGVGSGSSSRGIKSRHASENLSDLLSEKKKSEKSEKSDQSHNNERSGISGSNSSSSGGISGSSSAAGGGDSGSATSISPRSQSPTQENNVSPHIFSPRAPISSHSLSQNHQNHQNQASASAPPPMGHPPQLYRSESTKGRMEFTRSSMSAQNSPNCSPHMSTKKSLMNLNNPLNSLNSMNSGNSLNSMNSQDSLNCSSQQNVQNVAGTTNSTYNTHNTPFHEQEQAWPGAGLKDSLSDSEHGLGNSESGTSGKSGISISGLSDSGKGSSSTSISIDSPGPSSSKSNTSTLDEENTSSKNNNNINNNVNNVNISTATGTGTGPGRWSGTATGTGTASVLAGMGVGSSRAHLTGGMVLHGSSSGDNLAGLVKGVDGDDVGEEQHQQHQYQQHQHQLGREGDNEGDIHAITRGRSLGSGIEAAANAIGGGSDSSTCVIGSTDTGTDTGGRGFLVPLRRRKSSARSVEDDLDQLDAEGGYLGGWREREREETATALAAAASASASEAQEALLLLNTGTGGNDRNDRNNRNNRNLTMNKDNKDNKDNNGNGRVSPTVPSLSSSPGGHRKGLSGLSGGPNVGPMGPMGGGNGNEKGNNNLSPLPRGGGGGAGTDIMAGISKSIHFSAMASLSLNGSAPNTKLKRGASTSSVSASTSALPSSVPGDGVGLGPGLGLVLGGGVKHGHGLGLGLGLVDDLAPDSLSQEITSSDSSPKPTQNLKKMR